LVPSSQSSSSAVSPPIPFDCATMRCPVAGSYSSSLTTYSRVLIDARRSTSKLSDFREYEFSGRSIKRFETRLVHWQVMELVVGQPEVPQIAHPGRVSKQYQPFRAIHVASLVWASRNRSETASRFKRGAKRGHACLPQNCGSVVRKLELRASSSRVVIEQKL
jgi:hypothetical protein